jgi:Fic family protein
MNNNEFKAPGTGRLVPTIQGCMAFVPAPLPPPDLQLEGLAPLLTRAARALGELSGIGRTLQNPYLLIRPFMRREAVASSKIEGTVSDLSDLLLFELDEQTTRTPADAREVFNYVRALETSIASLDKLPISNRLIKEAHRILLTGVKTGRGSHIVPGEFKRDQNWIGARLIQNARFVPPPPIEAERAMGELEDFINTDCESTIPFIVKLALVHYQFETIHPFPDGNGRVGRLLIPLMLLDKKEMSQPLLYLSSFFEGRYDAYIDKMLSVSKDAKWADWIEFFLIGIEETCNDAIRKAQNLQELQSRYRSRIQQARASALLGTVIDQLFEHPAVTLPYLCKQLDITYNSAKKHVGRLVSLNILKEIPHGRPKTWIASEIFDVLVS